ncbi:hypothetical protein PBRA_000016 [Plasmodiophora brassicae]|uniref:Uncharacterized protein n=1 Tax=Plasmodiophora brassicae TaxID=37360 RepID=A0A0G4IGD0_PLABS|nr:hypothetical protein PBRA_000016 [Plasmodiophora brassicae]
MPNNGTAPCGTPYWFVMRLMTCVRFTVPMPNSFMKAWRQMTIGMPSDPGSAYCEVVCLRHEIAFLDEQTAMFVSHHTQHVDTTTAAAAAVHRSKSALELTTFVVSRPFNLLLLWPRQCLMVDFVRSRPQHDMNGSTSTAVIVASSPTAWRLRLAHEDAHYLVPCALATAPED